MREISISLCITFAALAAAAQGSIHLSPKGSDKANGSAQNPVRSLSRALQLAEKENTGAADIRIVLSGGTYRLRQPLRLSAADSGKNGHNIIFATAPGASPVISGAVRIAGWKLIDRARNVWTAAVPAAVKNTRQLYVNGLRATRTRGRVPIALTETPTGYEAADATLSHWKNPSDMEFVYTGGNSIWSEHSEGLGSWTEPRCPIAWIDGTTITMAQPCWNNSTKRVMLPNGARTANLVGPKSVGKRPEYMENAYELLGTPGQFYLDRTSHTLYYVPRKGEIMSTAVGSTQCPRRNTIAKFKSSPVRKKENP